MGQYLLYNKSNGGCPICQGTKSCKLDTHKELYYCRPNRGEVDGFRYIKESSNGIWGIYKRDNARWQDRSYTKSGNDRVIPTQKVVNQEQRETSPVTELPVVLGVKERDIEYRKAFSQLELSKNSKDDLIKRGLSDQFIFDYGFKSIGQNIYFANPVSKYLPGIKSSGKGFYTVGDGYVIPVLDISGLVVGYQQRLEKVDDGGKYRWAKSAHTKEFGELPLQHALVLKEPGQPLYLSEGVLKPLIAAFKHNVNFLGAAGGLFASSPKTFINTLDVLKPSDIILCPDAGSKSNNLVLNSYRKIERLLKKQGYLLKVLDYGQGLSKQEKDIDEIELNINTIKNCLYSEWDIVSRFDHQQDVDFSDETKWQEKQAVFSHSSWDKNKKNNSFINMSKEKSPDIFVDKNNENLSVGFPDEGKGLGLRLYTGQGKTTAIIRATMNKYRDRGAIYLPSRNSLGEQFVKDCDDYCDQHKLSDQNRFYMLKDMTAINRNYSFTSDTDSRLVLCPDSLDKFNPKDFDGRVLILDEVESSMRHILYGETIGDRLPVILELFRELLQRCYCVILADANLSDAVVECIEKMSGKPIVKVSNSLIPKRPDVFFYDKVGRHSQLLLAQVLKEPFPWVMSDSQIECETITQCGLRHDKKYLRIDSETINDSENPDQLKWIRAFLSNPEVVDQDDFPYDGIISSPCIESGLSSTSKRFSGVYLFIKHLESLYVSQMIMRSRNVECPRHLAIVDYVSSREYDSNLRSAFEKQIQKNLFDTYMLGLQQFVDDLPGERERLKEIALEKISGTFDSPETVLFTTFQAIKNYENQHLKECVLEVLQSSGFNIIFAEPDGEKVKGYRQDKRDVKEAKSEAIYQAPDITKEAYESLCKRSDLDKKERAKKEKYRLIQTMPGIDYPDIDTEEVYWSPALITHVKFKQPLSLQQAELRALTNIPELAKKRSAKGWEKVLNLKNKPKFLGNFKDKHPMVSTLIRLKVPELLANYAESELEYHHETPELVELWQRWDKKAALMTRVDRGASPTTLIKRLATKLGYKPFESNQDEERRYFKLSDEFADDFGAIIYKYVKNGLTTQLEKWTENYKTDQEMGWQNQGENLSEQVSFTHPTGSLNNSQGVGFRDDRNCFIDHNKQINNDDNSSYGHNNCSTSVIDVVAEVMPIVNWGDLPVEKEIFIYSNLENDRDRIAIHRVGVDEQTKIHHNGNWYVYHTTVCGEVSFRFEDKRLTLSDHGDRIAVRHWII